MLRLLALSHATRLILRNESHQIILHCQQLFQANWRVRQWRWSIATWGLATPTSDRTLRDVEDWVIGSPTMHHLP
jgi:hypothetical protein